MRMLRATLAAAALGTALAGPVAAKDFYRMSTLAPGSTIYVITAGFAQIVNKHVPEIELQVNATGTAVQFMLDAGRGNLDFYFSAALTGHFMKTGGAMYANVKEAPELYKNLRGIFSFSFNPGNSVGSSARAIRLMFRNRSRSSAARLDRIAEPLR